MEERKRNRKKSWGRLLGDVNGDGVTDTVDAALILQYTAEKITTF
ncbi:MAG: dockerin type I domain-containing protein [Hominisplanchenecus sp.]